MSLFHTKDDEPLKQKPYLLEPDCSDLLQGTLNEQRMIGIEGTVEGAPFRRMIAHPAIVKRFVAFQLLL